MENEYKNQLDAILIAAKQFGFVIEADSDEERLWTISGLGDYQSFYWSEDKSFSKLNDFWISLKEFFIRDATSLVEDEVSLYRLKIPNWEVGDSVVLTKEAKSDENGWSNAWVDEMSEYIGKEGVVSGVDRGHGFEIDFADGCNYEFPHFCLRKVEK